MPPLIVFVLPSAIIILTPAFEKSKFLAIEGVIDELESISYAFTITRAFVLVDFMVAPLKIKSTSPETETEIWPLRVPDKIKLPDSEMVRTEFLYVEL